MSWKDTREAPSPSWPWQTELNDTARTQPNIAPCDAMCCRITLEKVGHVSTLLDFGCGRAACLWEAKKAGIDDLIGVDVMPEALRLAERYVNARTSLSVDGVCDLPDHVADLVWSHGVVEHIEGVTLIDYFLEATRLSKKWVAFSAPNPNHEPYQAFRDHHLRRRTWVWGFEEPLESYAPLLRRMNCKVIYEGAPLGSWNESRVYAGQVGSNQDRSRWEKMYHDKTMQGPSTLVIAEIPSLTKK